MNSFFTFFFNFRFVFSILNAERSFNEHLGKLIAALEVHKSEEIQIELEHFAKEQELKLKTVNIDDSIQILSSWYQTCLEEHPECLTSEIPEISIQGGLYNLTKQLLTTEILTQGKLFNLTKRLLNKKTVVGKSLKYFDHIKNFLCIEKEISFYSKHYLNNNDYIIKFYGYSIQNCKPTLIYEYTNLGDLFTYFQLNHNLSENLDWEEKIKLSWKITQGVKYLHKACIFFLFYSFIHLFIYLFIF